MFVYIRSVRKNHLEGKDYLKIVTISTVQRCYPTKVNNYRFYMVISAKKMFYFLNQNQKLNNIQTMLNT